MDIGWLVSNVDILWCSYVSHLDTRETGCGPIMWSRILYIRYTVYCICMHVTYVCIYICMYMDEIVQENEPTARAGWRVCWQDYWLCAGLSPTIQSSHGRQRLLGSQKAAQKKEGDRIKQSKLCLLTCLSSILHISNDYILNGYWFVISLQNTHWLKYICIYKNSSLIQIPAAWSLHYACH